MGSILFMPYFIRKLIEKNLVVRDFYKSGEKFVPTGGGIAIILISLLGLSLNSLFFKFETMNYVILVVISSFALFGILDDMIDIGRASKLLIMYYCSYPLIQYVTHTTVAFPLLGYVDLGSIYLQLIVPTYVLVAANLINMHSGYNGMSSGLSVMILMTLIIKSLIIMDIEIIFSMISITGATLGFYLFERYPSKIFWGNIGSLAIGSTIGVFIVVQGFVVSGFIMLIPHTINFLLYAYWKIRKHPIAKFGKIRSDGTLEVPNPLTLKWILPYYMRVNEKQATRAMFIVTGVFCVIGLFVP
jgi:UDP-N-acetylglucosamine--dolichyl-phosphate N-acetylglucosaminephosphotransferase